MIKIKLIDKDVELNIEGMDILHIDVKHYWNSDVLVATAFDKENNIIDSERHIIKK